MRRGEPVASHCSTNQTYHAARYTAKYDSAADLEKIKIRYPDPAIVVQSGLSVLDTGKREVETNRDRIIH